MDWRRTYSVLFIGKISCDLSVAEPIVQGIPVIEYSNNSVTKIITNGGTFHEK